jgi:hypothetical protein
MMPAVRRIGGLEAAILPTRVWPFLEDRVPVRSSAFLSGLVTFGVGAVIGIPTYPAHAQVAATVDIEVLLTAAGWPAPAHHGKPPLLGLSDVAWLTFVFLTPLGLISTYLVVTGACRAIAAGFDDPLGDPLLTGISAAWCAARDRRAARRAAESRRALEVPEVPDRIVSGPQAGFPSVDIVVVSSRLKQGWTAGTVMDTGEGFYRIGVPVERIVADRLRTLYPLTRHPDVEVIRRSVRYELQNSGRPAAGG